MKREDKTPPAIKLLDAEDNTIGAQIEARKEAIRSCLRGLDEADEGDGDVGIGMLLSWAENHLAVLRQLYNLLED